MQKRVAMHMRTCELDPAFADELRRALSSLEAKARCNAKIDAVVLEECAGDLAARVKIACDSVTFHWPKGPGPNGRKATDRTFKAAAVKKELSAAGAATTYNFITLG